MSSKFYLFFLFIFLFGVNSCFSAPSFEGAYYDWFVYTFENLDGEKECYIASFAKKAVGNYTEARRPYIMLTYFKDKAKEEVSVFGDFIYKKNSFIYILMNDKQFKLLTKDKMAWAQTEQEDAELINNFIKSNKIKIKSETADGKYAIDEYSGKGFLSAYNKMKMLCK